ncbi:MAG: hypothetical protein ACLFQX_11395 [Candidatus Kapaibacterium sp.]
MKKIETVSSLEGRRFLQKIYKELRFEKQRSALAALLILWRICVREKDIYKHSKYEVTALHSLGIVKGTALWMQEIVNRHFFSTINSFVYLGAAVLLVLIGVRRFSEGVSIELVIAGIVFEALMLVFMFIVMLFSPSEEISIEEEDGEPDAREIVEEIGEIGRDFAAALVQLEEVNARLDKSIQMQFELIQKAGDIAKATANAVAPNPAMLDEMRRTGDSLGEFRATVDRLNDSVKALRKEEIELCVRREIEKIIVDKLAGQ